MGIRFKGSTGFDKTRRALESLRDSADFRSILDRYGERGVYELSEATPKDSGKTASSWSYRIRRSERKNSYSIEFFNSNENDGYSIALLIQYGHGTRNGAYVSGIDYVNPVSRRILEGLAKDIWKEVLALWQI